MVLAYPGFVIAQSVEMLNQFEVALKRCGWILVLHVKRGHEDAKLKTLRKRHIYLVYVVLSRWMRYHPRPRHMDSSTGHIAPQQSYSLM